MQDGTLKKILDNLTADYEAAKENILENAPKVAAKVTKYTWHICLIFLASFLVTIPILFAGIVTESKTLILTAGIMRGLITVAFLIMMYPVLLAIEILADGISGSVKRSISFIKSVFVGELIIITLAAWFPLKNNPDMILMFFVLATLAAFLGSRVLTQKVATAIVAVLLLLTGFSFFAPYSMQSLGKKIRGADQETGMPQRIDGSMTCNGFKQNEYKFFGEGGEPLKFHYRNWKTQEDEVFVLTSNNKTHPGNGELLQPMTKNDKDRLEDQICAKEAKQKQDAEDAVKKEQQAAKDSASLPPLFSGPNSSPAPEPAPFSPPIVAATPAPELRPAPAPEVRPTPAPRPAPTPEPRETYRTDDRKEYAVVAANGDLVEHPGLEKAMVEWLGPNRSFCAREKLNTLSLYENGIDTDSRTQLSKSAKKILYAVYKTRCQRNHSGSLCSASTAVSVIDTNTGNIIKREPLGSFSERDINSAQRKAFGSIKHSCLRNL